MVDPTAFARVAAPQRRGIGGGLAAIIAGEQAGRAQRQEQLQQQAQQIGQSAFQAWSANDQQGYQERLRQLSTIDPKAADDLNSMFSGIQKQNLGEAAFRIYAASASPDMEAKKKLLGQAQDVLQADPNNVFAQGINRMMAIDDQDQLDEELIGSVQMAQNMGLFPSASALGGGGRKAPPSQKTGSWLVQDDKGNVMPMVGSFDPATGQLTTQYGQALPEGYKVVGKEGEAPSERRQAEVEQTRAQQRVKTQEQRITQVIDRGITAAESIPNLKRGLELLDLVETGGIRAAGLRAKQLFGIETGDEGELANRLSKSVLSQLRTTFGAAFTENEGKRLERIEAGFTKNTETNKRLLNQALRMAQRKAQAARQAAMDVGDQYTVDEIDDLMSFTYSLAQGQQETGQTSPQRTGQQAPQMQQFSIDQAEQIPVFRTIEEGTASGADQFRVPTGDPARPFKVYAND